MKGLKKFLWLVIVLLALMLTGCLGGMRPIAIDTVLTVDTSFDGSRVMTAQISASVFKSVFNSDTENLESVINAYSPGDMYCIAYANDEGALIEMHIDFASRNEYQKKIETICAGNSGDSAITPVITFSYSRSMLKNGYTIEENFTSLDLFYWLADALATEYSGLSGKNLEDIFELGTTTVIFDGEETQMTDYIQISTTQASAFNSIEIVTTLDTNEMVSAEITYVVANEVVEKLGERLETLMSGIVSSTATMTWEDTDSVRVYTLTIEKESVSAYVTDMNKALRASNTVFEVTTQGDSDALTAKMSVMQYYDAGFFLDFTDENTEFVCVLNVMADYTVESCVGTYGYLRSQNAVYGEDNCEITMVLGSAEEVTTVFGFAVDITQVDVSTTIYSDTDMERQIDFTLSSDADDLIGSSIFEKLKMAAASWKTEGAMTVSSEKLVSSVRYRISMSAGSVAELTQMPLLVLGSDTDDATVNSSLTGGTKTHTNPWKITCAFEDTINLSEFLNGSQATNGIHYTLTYPSGYKAFLSEDNIYEDAVAMYGTITCSTSDKVLTVRSTATKNNMEGILIFAIWALALFYMLIIALFNMKTVYHLIRYRSFRVRGPLFEGKNLIMISVAIISFVCFVFMGLRLLLRIY